MTIGAALVQGPRNATTTISIQGHSLQRVRRQNRISAEQYDFAKRGCYGPRACSARRDVSEPRVES
jgi:hypothetical protein